MLEQRVTIINQLGLHARAAARLVHTASQFESAVWLERTDCGLSADAKSILSVLTLAATCGTELRATAEGADEQAAISAVCRLIADGLGEVEG